MVTRVAGASGRRHRHRRRRDLAVSADDATYALTEVKLGLAAAIISLTVHARMSPRAAALTTLGGETFTGARPRSTDWSRPAVPPSTSTRRSPPSAPSWPPARRRAAGVEADPQRRPGRRIDARGAAWPPQRPPVRLDEAREAMTAFLNRSR